MANIYVIQGPNLNLLGKRETSIYGIQSLEDLHRDLIKRGEELGLFVECFQSNHEGEIVDIIQQAREKADYIIINPAAYTHTSVAVRDALLAAAVPAIEVHISNIYARESFRKESLIADVVRGQIAGLGILGYYLALRAVYHFLAEGGALL